MRSSTAELMQLGVVSPSLLLSWAAVLLNSPKGISLRQEFPGARGSYTDPLNKGLIGVNSESQLRSRPRNP